MMIASLLFALALAQTGPEFPRYGSEVLEKAKSANTPLVTFVGLKPAGPVPGAVTCVADTLEGYPTPSIVVSEPAADGKVYWKATLSADTKPDDVLKPQAPPIPDALDEVNAKRARKGLRPLMRDDGLTIAAYRCATARAQSLIAGHLANDFSYLPSGAHATSAGCGALEPSWGWETCCYDDPRYSVGGAAWVMGRDGKRYMHIFVR